jgi:hypothetical protein
MTGVNLTGTCETGLPVQLSGAGLAAPVSAACTAGGFSVAISFSAGDGVKPISAAQTDAAGNTGRDSRDFARDDSAPLVRITSPAANTATASGLTLAGVCETGLPVDLSGDIAAATTACTAGHFSFDIVLSGADGAKTIEARQTDATGNTASDTRAFLLDTTKPRVTITAPADGSDIAASFTLQGDCEPGLMLVISGDLSAPSTTLCPMGGVYSVALNAAGAAGIKQIVAAQTDAAGNSGEARAAYNVLARPTQTDVFIADASEGKVDILFIDDNSASMEFEQSKLGQKFTSFVAQLQGLDWQVGITTTDCSPGTWGICGSLLPMAGLASAILTPAVAAFDQVFMNTIYRPETVDCANKGACPSGNEEALKAAITAMDKRDADNAGFFRDGAALALVVLTDEDEQSTAPSTATTPQAVVDHFNALWGGGKKMKSYAITVLSGDAACLKMQQDQQGGVGAYGTYAMELARLTGGESQSICAADYSGILRQIGDDLRTVTSAVTLSHPPASAAAIQISFVPAPAQPITWSLSGQTVLFDSPIPAGTRITVTYEE